MSNEISVKQNVHVALATRLIAAKSDSPCPMTTEVDDGAQSNLAPSMRSAALPFSSRTPVRCAVSPLMIEVMRRAQSLAMSRTCAIEMAGVAAGPGATSAGGGAGAGAEGGGKDGGALSELDEELPSDARMSLTSAGLLPAIDDDGAGPEMDGEAEAEATGEDEEEVTEEE